MVGRTGLVLCCPAGKGWSQPLFIGVPAVMRAWSKRKSHPVMSTPETWTELASSPRPSLSDPATMMPDAQASLDRACFKPRLVLSDPAMNTPAAVGKPGPSLLPKVVRPSIEHARRLVRACFKPRLVLSDPAMNTPTAVGKPGPSLLQAEADVVRPSHDDA